MHISEVRMQASLQPDHRIPLMAFQFRRSSEANYNTAQVLTLVPYNTEMTMSNPLDAYPIRESYSNTT
jgi:hypothetical protein